MRLLKLEKTEGKKKSDDDECSVICLASGESIV